MQARVVALGYVTAAGANASQCNGRNKQTHPQRDLRIKPREFRGRKRSRSRKKNSILEI
jgi:hypothetical protein